MAQLSRNLARTVGLLVVFVLLAVANPPAQAQAGAGYDDNRVPFGSVDGKVQALHGVGDQLWVGGDFTTATDADLVTTHDRLNLAVFNFNTGDVRSLAPQPNDAVKAIVSDGARRVYVGGNFTQIAGQPVSYLAAFDLLTGQLDPTFSVTLNGDVNTLHLDGDDLYVGGDFYRVDGQRYLRIARLDAATGDLDLGFQTNPDTTVRSIDTFGDRVYISGDFEELGDDGAAETRIWFATLDAATGEPVDPDLSFAPIAGGENPTKRGIRQVAISPDGSSIYTGDDRNRVTRWDRLTGEMIWSRETEGDIQALVVEGDTVYAGNHHGLLAEYDERLLFALNAADGSPDNSFMPLLNSYHGTYSIHLAQGALIAGGEFTTVNDQASPHLAVFHGPGWLGAEPIAAPDGDVGCDGQANIVDALLIAQYSVGNRQLEPSCPLDDPAKSVAPSGDVDNDGEMTIVDALLIAQCTVSIPNIACPNP